MKKLLIIFILLLFSTVVLSQQAKQMYVPDPNGLATSNVTAIDNDIYNGWLLHGNTCAGCPSYYIQIRKTTTTHLAEDSRYYYYYYFYFFSNSHYSDGTEAATYLKGVELLENGRTLVTIPYIVADKNTNMHKAWLRTTQPNSNIRISVYEMYVQ